MDPRQTIGRYLRRHQQVRAPQLEQSAGFRAVLARCDTDKGCFRCLRCTRSFPYREDLEEHIQQTVCSEHADERFSTIRMLILRSRSSASSASRPAALDGGADHPPARPHSRSHAGARRLSSLVDGVANTKAEDAFYRVLLDLFGSCNVGAMRSSICFEAAPSTVRGRSSSSLDPAQNLPVRGFVWGL